MEQQEALSEVSVSHTAQVAIVLVTIMSLLVLFGSFYFLISTLQKLLSGGA